MAEYSKEKISLMQLTAAIELYNKRQFIPAITLGSAAEELNAVFLKQYGKRNNKRVSTKAELDKAMFDMFRHFLGIKDYMAYRNNTRNELKHHGDVNNKKTVKGNFRMVALNHISGAIINHKLRTNELPKNKIVRDFCSEQGIS